MSIYTYRYKAPEARRVLHMEIDCAIVPYAEFSGHIIELNGLIYLGLPAAWSESNPRRREITEFMLFALAKLLPELAKHISTPIVIQIVHADFYVPDFQEEVFGYALVGWLCREFDLEYQLPVMVYDKNANKYLRP